MCFLGVYLLCLGVSLIKVSFASVFQSFLWNCFSGFPKSLVSNVFPETTDLFS